jgi:hypothetical protein
MSDSKKPARPWDLFNSAYGRVESEILSKRLDICKTCDRFINITSQCKECGCIMTAKAKLPHAFCPLHKWDSVDISKEVKKYEENNNDK